MDILEGIIDRNTDRIITIFLKNPSQLYHLKKISIDSGVPIATAFRIVNRLSKCDFLKIIKISKLKLYSLNDCKKTRELRGLL